MLIAPEFAFVHLSKTGGTFAEQTIRELLCPSFLGRKLHRYKKKYGLRLPFYRYRYKDVGDQHALCIDIPESEREKPVLSIIRNPFDLYVSEYTFRWWVKYPHLWFQDVASIEREQPSWKELDFEEFFRLSNREASWVRRTLAKHPQASNLGWYSHKFVYYFCREHDYVFSAAEDLDRLEQRVRETMFPVHFIHTERLNQELYEFLLLQGYPKQRIHHIPLKEKVNSSRKERNWRKWYSEELRREIETRDALIFRLFPEYQF